ncbi:MAG: PEP-CTERM sorting domain-containing protein [Microcystis sp. M53603_WE2]|jgi:hypothetical protein|uniref:PEP-CTERM sorting domain-containing protein n=1 Tax=unclassified Microcystis TaxID=2643300 RepID=UPI00259006F0|nr:MULTISPECIES: PEP-CTERM sorting domain-containing protein [unclassified Microcystis]MDJ0538386.1 PEP-CTERM sorting domain-containing protein [Microcystis sp. M53603_WE2]MDJ0567256.1 PEP-CTERM sorting domain-containing protein [Microcystis sp. M49629_WE12]MDJ0605183.1 PEP-CTERM sorting domain-containing protein [Microcystis sp. M53602_WE12]
MINTRLKPVTTGLIGAVGLGVALLGMPEMAEAVDIKAGIDYLFTPKGSDTWVDFDRNGPNGRTYFKGVPILPGGTDTAVKRLDDCHFDINGKCTVGLQFVSLNLESVKPVPDFGNQIVFLMLDDSHTQPVSSMTIMDIGNNMATWTNTLDFYWKLVDSDSNVLATGFESFIGSGKGTYNDDGHFSVITYDDQAEWARHTDKIPEPSTVLGLIAVGLSSIVGFKGKKEPK